MLPRRIRLFEIFDIPVFADVSLVVLLVLFVVSSGSLFYGLNAALVLAFSIVAHELGHALAARAFGYRTRDITLSLLGGCASLIAMPRRAYQEFLTAIAGPLVSFALALAGRLALPSALEAESTFGVITLENLMWFNLCLGAFNLLPGFPLDGGRIFRSVMRAFMSRATATRVAMIVGRVVAVLIGLEGLSRLFSGTGWGFITIMIAVMIWREGYREYELAKLEERWGYDSPTGYSARVSPPPYGGSDDEVDVERE